MECVSQRRVTLTSQTGYLGSAASRMVGQSGTSSCPYRLQGKPGQRFNITLYNFASTSQLTADSSARKVSRVGPDVCHEIAVIQDGRQAPKRSFTVCSRQPRTIIGLVSQSHEVDIHFVSRSSEASGIQFLIKYEGTHYKQH